MQLPKILELFRRHRSLSWFAITTIIATTIGMFLDFDGFFVNVLAGFIGTFIGIVVSIAIIESLLQIQNAKHWEDSRRTLLLSIVIQLNAAVREFVDLLPITSTYKAFYDHEDKISEQKVFLIRRLHAELKAQSTDTLRDEYLVLFDTINIIITNINSLRTSYMVTPGAENEIVTRLTQINNEFTRWYRLINRNRRKPVVSDALLERSLSTLDAIAATLKSCCNSEDYDVL